MDKAVFKWDDYLEANPLFKQVKVDELLFAAYDCPLEASPLDYWVKKNYFCYIIKGGARWKTPTEQYIFKVGDAAFLTKGAHRVYKIDNGEFCALMVFLPDEFIASVVKKDAPFLLQKNLPITPDSVMPLRLDQTLKDYFGGLLTYFSQPKPPSKSLLKIKFRELLINIVTNNHNPKVTAYFKEIASRGRRSVKSVMEEHFIFNLKLEDFAKLCNRSLSSFKRDFYKAYGTTPGIWLKRKRLERGKFLLETTDLNINEIASDIGFQNSSHFVKAFKGRYHHPPLQFRKLPKSS